MSHAVYKFVAQRVSDLEIERQANRFQTFRINDEARHMRVGQALLVEILLHARDADIVLVDITDHMGRDRSVGIDPLILRHKADSRQPEMENLRLLLRRHLTLDPDEALLRRQPFAQILGVEIGQDRGQEFDCLVLVDDVGRFGEDGHRLDVGREHFPVAIEKIGPGAGDGLVGGALSVSSADRCDTPKNHELDGDAA